MFTEEDAKTNWVNRKEGDLAFTFPDTLEKLELFKDGHLLECFKCWNKEAINYETKALHLSAQKFFEKTDVKKVIY